MPPSIKIKTNTRQASERLRKLARKMTKEGMDMATGRAAWKCHTRLSLLTPKKWTGNTRKSWTVTRRASGHYAVWNKSIIMRYLELGTKPHGPVRAKMLFIPKTRRAAMAGARVVLARPGAYTYGRDFILKKRVRGIKARRIATRFAPMARKILKDEMKAYTRFLLNSPG